MSLKVMLIKLTAKVKSILIRTVVEPIQLVPDPPAVQVWIPDDTDVSAKFPAVPPEITVVWPPSTGRLAIPLEGVIADCVTSPA